MKKSFMEKQLRIGIINHWPGEKTAELEFIKRFRQVASLKGNDCFVLNNLGFHIDDEGKILDPCHDNLDFIMAFDAHMLGEIFHENIYVPLWIPPGFIHKDVYKDWFLNLNRCDALLSGFGSKQVIENARQAWGLSGRDLGELIEFFPSPPRGYALPPKPNQNRKLFYAGVNCERLTHENGQIVLRHGRFHELFSILDKTGYTEFFGPKKFGGQKTWDGFDSYRGELPFDGRSILQKANDLGVSLVLSSKIHHYYKLPTSRLFEAMASGSVVIADNNPFVIEHLENCVLIIDSTQSEPSIAAQINEKMIWINNNPDLALALAKKSHDLFLKKYALEYSVENLITFHDNRKKNAEFFGPHRVDLILLYNGQSLSVIDSIIHAINQQSYKNIHLFFVCPKELVYNFSKKLDKSLNVPHGVISFTTENKFNFSDIAKHLEGDYFCILDSGTELHNDHLHSLLQVANRETVVAYSGNQVFFNSKDIDPVLMNAPLNLEDLFSFLDSKQSDFFTYLSSALNQSCFLFKKCILQKSKSEHLECLKGYEHIYLLLLALTHYGESSAQHSFRVTCKSFFKNEAPNDHLGKAFKKIDNDLFSIFAGDQCALHKGSSSGFHKRKYENYINSKKKPRVVAGVKQQTIPLLLQSSDIGVIRLAFDFINNIPHKMHFNAFVLYRKKKQVMLLHADDAHSVLVSPQIKIGQKTSLTFLLPSKFCLNRNKLYVYCIDYTFFTKLRVHGFLSFFKKKKRHKKVPYDKVKELLKENWDQDSFIQLTELEMIPQETIVCK